MAGPFHMAFGVRDLDSTRAFYGEVLGCEMGRSAPTWQDFDFFGHQLSAHVTDAAAEGGGQVEGLTVPIPHFGAVLEMGAWDALAKRLEARGVAFHVAPRIRFEGEPGEQGTFFVKDPSGNTLEFKGFKDMAGMFAVGA
jgi:extradiol dioxygenase family protein